MPVTDSLNIFVITLPHASDRQATISARLKELGLPFTFFEGVDGRQLDLPKHPNYAPLKRRLFYGRDLSGGELGCILAHRKLYDHILQKQLEYVLVLEDDAILTDQLPAVLSELLKLKTEWDLIRFLGREKNYIKTRNIIPLPTTETSFVRQLGMPGGTYGYLINRKAAARLEEMTRLNWLPIDTLHGSVWLTKLRTFSVKPSPILPNDQFPSFIDTQDNNLRWDKSVKLDGWMRVVYPITRGAWKFYLNCCTQSVRIVSWAADRGLARQLDSPKNAHPQP